MPKIVIIANTHPNESIALKTALRVARMLKQNPENEVVIERIPFKQTNLGFLRRIAIEGKKTTDKKLDYGIFDIAKEKSRQNFKQCMELKKKHGTAYYFEFHTTPRKRQMDYAYVHNYTLENDQGGKLEEAGIVLFHPYSYEDLLPNFNCFEMYVPYKPMPEKHQKIFETGMKKLRLSEVEKIRHYASYTTKIADEKKFLQEANPETQVITKDIAEQTLDRISKGIAKHIERTIKDGTALQTKPPTAKRKARQTRKKGIRIIPKRRTKLI